MSSIMDVYRTFQNSLLGKPTTEAQQMQKQALSLKERAALDAVRIYEPIVSRYMCSQGHSFELQGLPERHAYCTATLADGAMCCADGEPIINQQLYAHGMQSMMSGLMGASSSPQQAWSSVGLGNALGGAFSGGLKGPGEW